MQERLLASCKEQLIKVARATLGKDALVFVGLPLERKGKLYNVAAAVHNGALFPRLLFLLTENFMKQGIFRQEIKKPKYWFLKGKKFLLGQTF